jgi:hypothetical protein
MKKLCYVLAALTTIAVAAPTVASAEGFGVYVGGDRDHYYHRGPRAEFYDRDWHRGWYHHHDYYGERGVIVRHHNW